MNAEITSMKISNISEILSTVKHMTNNEIPFVNLYSSKDKPQYDGIIFFKPEVCSLPNDILGRVLTYFDEMLSLHSINILNTSIISGPFLISNHIIDKNYETIRTNSLLSLNIEDNCNDLLSSIFSKYGCCQIKGGLFLANQGYSPEFLLDLWLNSGPISKIDTDFYGIPCMLNGKRTFLVNAFFPIQIEQYKDKNSKIIFFTFKTKTPFTQLKTYFQGNAAREERAKSSLREYIATIMEEYDMEKMTTSRNGLHMSGSRLEGKREAKIFLSHLYKDTDNEGRI